MTEYDAMGDLMESLGYPEWAAKLRSLAWAAVEDRLPPPADVEDERPAEYLVWCRYEDGSGEAEVGSHVGGGRFEDLREYLTLNRVTHWRPLPDRP